MRKLIIKTQDGDASASLFKPITFEGDTKELTGVIFYMDAIGPREALFNMAQRLADAGYVVLLPDLFYRFGDYGPFTHASLADEASLATILKMVSSTSQAQTASDNIAFINYLQRHAAKRPFGAVGYCMGGGRAITAAALHPNEIGAVASFHGGDLASSNIDSPHLKVNSIRAAVYIGMAGVDPNFPPEQSTRLIETLRGHELDFIVENYIGMHHGWTVPDRDGVFNHYGAERHWLRLSTFFKENLL